MGDAPYDNRELTDIHFTYGLADGNAARAQQLYRERYPLRRIPHPQLFSRLHNRLRDHGTLQAHRPRAGRPRTQRTPQMEEAILQQFENNPSTSTRAVGSTLNISHSMVHEVASDDGLHPFHFQKVHRCKPEDAPLRMDFARFLIDQVANNPDWPDLIMFSDEATFTRDGVINLHNRHQWTHENPHGTYIRAHQERFTVNVWAAMIGRYFIGPYIMPARLNGQAYQIFLEQVLPEHFEDVPLETRRNMWFQHDGAPVHFRRGVRQFLDHTFPGRWIGRGGPVPWPPRSPDFTPLDFFYWGYMKELVYDGTEINNVEELVARIAVAAGIIKDNAENIAGAVRVAHQPCAPFFARRYPWRQF